MEEVLSRLGEIEYKGKYDEKNCLAVLEVWDIFSGVPPEDVPSYKEVFRRLIKVVSRTVLSGLWMKIREKSLLKLRANLTTLISNLKRTNSEDEVKQCLTITMLLEGNPWLKQSVQEILHPLSNEHTGKMIDTLWEEEGWIFLESRLETLCGLPEAWLVEFAEACVLKGQTQFSDANQKPCLSFYDLSLEKYFQVLAIFSVAIVRIREENQANPFQKLKPYLCQSSIVIETVRRLLDTQNPARLQPNWKGWKKAESIALKILETEMTEANVTEREEADLRSIFFSWLSLSYQMKQRQTNEIELPLQLTSSPSPPWNFETQDLESVLPENLKSLLESAVKNDYVYKYADWIVQFFGFNPLTLAKCVELYLGRLSPEVSKSVEFHDEEHFKDIFSELNRSMAMTFRSLSKYFLSHSQVTFEILLTIFSLHPTRTDLDRLGQMATDPNSGVDVKSRLLRSHNMSIGLPSALYLDFMNVVHGARLNRLTCFRESWEKFGQICEKHLETGGHDIKRLSDLHLAKPTDFSLYVGMKPAYDDDDAGYEAGYFPEATDFVESDDSEKRKKSRIREPRSRMGMLYRLAAAERKLALTGGVKPKRTYYRRPKVINLNETNPTEDSSILLKDKVKPLRRKYVRKAAATVRQGQESKVKVESLILQKLRERKGQSVKLKEENQKSTMDEIESKSVKSEVKVKSEMVKSELDNESKLIKLELEEDESKDDSDDSEYLANKKKKSKNVRLPGIPRSARSVAAQARTMRFNNIRKSTQKIYRVNDNSTLCVQVNQKICSFERRSGVWPSSTSAEDVNGVFTFPKLPFDFPIEESNMPYHESAALYSIGRSGKILTLNDREHFSTIFTPVAETVLQRMEPNLCEYKYTEVSREWRKYFGEIVGQGVDINPLMTTNSQEEMKSNEEEKDSAAVTPIISSQISSNERHQWEKEARGRFLELEADITRVMCDVGLTETLPSEATLNFQTSLPDCKNFLTPSGKIGVVKTEFVEEPNSNFPVATLTDEIEVRVKSEEKEYKHMPMRENDSIEANVESAKKESVGENSEVDDAYSQISKREALIKPANDNSEAMKGDVLEEPRAESFLDNFVRVEENIENISPVLESDKRNPPGDISISIGEVSQIRSPVEHYPEVEGSVESSSPTVVDIEKCSPIGGDKDLLSVDENIPGEEKQMKSNEEIIERRLSVEEIENCPSVEEIHESCPSVEEIENCSSVEEISGSSSSSENYEKWQSLSDFASESRKLKAIIRESPEVDISEANTPMSQSDEADDVTFLSSHPSDPDVFSNKRSTKKKKRKEVTPISTKWKTPKRARIENSLRDSVSSAFPPFTPFQDDDMNSTSSCAESTPNLRVQDATLFLKELVICLQKLTPEDFPRYQGRGTKTEDTRLISVLKPPRKSSITKSSTSVKKLKGKEESSKLISSRPIADRRSGSQNASSDITTPLNPTIDSYIEEDDLSSSDTESHSTEYVPSDCFDSSASTDEDNSLYGLIGRIQNGSPATQPWENYSKSNHDSGSIMKSLNLRAMKKELEVKPPPLTIPVPSNVNNIYKTKVNTKVKSVLNTKVKKSTNRKAIKTAELERQRRRAEEMLARARHRQILPRILKKREIEFEIESQPRRPNGVQKMKRTVQKNLPSRKKVEKDPLAPDEAAYPFLPQPGGGRVLYLISPPKVETVDLVSDDDEENGGDDEGNGGDDGDYILPDLTSTTPFGEEEHDQKRDPEEILPYSIVGSKKIFLCDEIEIEAILPYDEAEEDGIPQSKEIEEILPDESSSENVNEKNFQCERTAKPNVEVTFGDEIFHIGNVRKTCDVIIETIFPMKEVESETTLNLLDNNDSLQNGFGRDDILRENRLMDTPEAILSDAVNNEDKVTLPKDKVVLESSEELFHDINLTKVPEKIQSEENVNISEDSSPVVIDVTSEQLQIPSPEEQKEVFPANPTQQIPPLEVGNSTIEEPHSNFQSIEIEEESDETIREIGESEVAEATQLHGIDEGEQMEVEQNNGEEALINTRLDVLPIEINEEMMSEVEEADLTQGILLSVDTTVIENDILSHSKSVIIHEDILFDVNTLTTNEDILPDISSVKEHEDISSGVNTLTRNEDNLADISSVKKHENIFSDVNTLTTTEDILPEISSVKEHEDNLSDVITLTTNDDILPAINSVKEHEDILSDVNTLTANENILQDISSVKEHEDILSDVNTLTTNEDILQDIRSVKEHEDILSDVNTLTTNEDILPDIILVKEHEDILSGVKMLTTNEDILPGISSVKEHEDISSGVNTLTTNVDNLADISPVKKHEDIFSCVNTLTTNEDILPEISSVKEHEDNLSDVITLTTNEDILQDISSVKEHEDILPDVNTLTTNEDILSDISSVKEHKEILSGVNTLTTNEDILRDISSVIKHEDILSDVNMLIKNENIWPDISSVIKHEGILSDVNTLLRSEDILSGKSLIKNEDVLSGMDTLMKDEDISIESESKSMNISSEPHEIFAPIAVIPKFLPEVNQGNAMRKSETLLKSQGLLKDGMSRQEVQKRSHVSSRKGRRCVVKLVINGGKKPKVENGLMELEPGNGEMLPPPPPPQAFSSVHPPVKGEGGCSVTMNGSCGFKRKVLSPNGSSKIQDETTEKCVTVSGVEETKLFLALTKVGRQEDEESNPPVLRRFDSESDENDMLDPSIEGLDEPPKIPCYGQIKITPAEKILH